ncbi:hypothetical protein HJO_03895 [Hyphomonas johnsonii MHS-2]|uniref:Uncharacterized protein n=1 Tax=Hyphomonas johnsonii MHS-2 TaxID=1280950 RepID=A0A059FV53_9PROT|nr:hypothetical protein HJO_03895 [Hyphomonas johnsonii MHS-2]
MMSPNSALSSRRAANEYSLRGQVNADSRQFDEVVHGKWPAWVRLLVIIGLSALLWTGIISGIVALVG